jgi:hypothetical protein
MRFNPTTSYTNYARSVSKTLQWSVYVRTVTSLSESLDSGTAWTTATNYLEAIPDLANRIEYELGQFNTDSINFVGMDASWWLANCFTDATLSDNSKYVEVKVTHALGMGSSTTSEYVAFYGFVDKSTVDLNEVEDSVAFGVNSISDIAANTSANVLTTRYPFTTSSISAVQLPKIPGIYLYSASISNYGISEGYHEIEYKYEWAQASGSVANSNATASLKLDGGREVPFYWIQYYGSSSLVNYETSVDPNVTLGNEATGSLDTERIMAYCDVSVMTKITGSSYSYMDQFVMLNKGDALPYTWYQFIGAKDFLNKCFNVLGLVSASYDTLQVGSYDGRTDISYMDRPPADDGTYGTPTAMVPAGTGSIYVALDNVLYKKDVDTLQYTTIGTFSASIDRLLYDNINDYVWVLYNLGPTVATKAKVYAAQTGVTSSEYSTDTKMYRTSVDVFPSTSGFIGISSSYNAVVQVTYNGSTFSKSTIATTASLSPTCATMGQWGQVCGSKYYLYGTRALGQYTYYYLSHSGGSWGAGGWLGDTTAAYVTRAVYIPTENAIYHYSSTNGRLYKHPSGSADVDLGLAPLSGSNQDITSYALGPSNDTAYFIGKDFINRNGFLIKVSGSSVSTSIETNIYPNPAYYLFTTWPSYDALLGITNDRRLYRYGNTLEMYVEDGNSEGKTVQDVITSICQAFNLVYLVRTNKSVVVFKRSDLSGNTITTGNTLTVTSGEISSLKRKVNEYKSYDYLTIDNGLHTTSYDGAAFDETPALADVQLNIKNTYMPTNMQKDMLYYMYQFFKNYHDLWTVELGNVPLYQYEPLDELSFTVSNGHVLNGTTSGIIYNTSLTSTGDVIFQVIV